MAAHLIRAATAVLVIGGLAACGPAEEPGAGRDVSLLPRDRLELPELDFEQFRALLGELRGTPVVVNVWASWCAPCRAEAPGLARLAREFSGSVQFLGVDILDDRASAREFILEFDWPYPSIFDPAGEIRDRLGYVGQPITILYDRAGEVAFDWVGVVAEDRLRAEIQRVLGTEGGSALDTAFQGLCAAGRLAEEGDLEGAGELFTDRAHAYLHELAAELSEIDRAAAAELLVAKQQVEAALAGPPASDPSDGATLIERLREAVARGARLTGLPEPTCEEEAR